MTDGQNNLLTSSPEKKDWLTALQKLALDHPGIEKIVLEYTGDQAINEHLFFYDCLSDNIRERFTLPFFTICQILEHESGGWEMITNVHASEHHVEVVIYSGDHVLGTWSMPPNQLNFADRDAFEAWLEETYQCLKERLEKTITTWTILTLSTDDIYGACEQLDLSERELKRVHEHLDEIAGRFKTAYTKNSTLDPLILKQAILEILDTWQE